MLPSTAAVLGGTTLVNMTCAKHKKPNVREAASPRWTLVSMTCAGNKKPNAREAALQDPEEG